MVDVTRERRLRIRDCGLDALGVGFGGLVWRGPGFRFGAGGGVGSVCVEKKGRGLWLSGVGVGCEGLYDERFGERGRCMFLCFGCETDWWREMLVNRLLNRTYEIPLVERESWWGDWCL